MGKEKKTKECGVDHTGMVITQPPKTIQNKDHFQRLNYLLQLSTFHTMTNDQDHEDSLARMYIKSLDLIQKKTKTSVTPHFKRNICKKCHRVLIPNKTLALSIQNKSKKQHSSKSDVLEMRCVCGQVRRFPIGVDKAFKLHSEKDGNLIDLERKLKNISGQR